MDACAAGLLKRLSAIHPCWRQRGITGTTGTDSYGCGFECAGLAAPLSRKARTP